MARKLQLQEGDGGGVGGVRGGELGRERGREKNANKMKGGKQQQSAGLRIIWLICFANLIFKTGSLSRTKTSQYCEINSGSSFSFASVLPPSFPALHARSMYFSVCDCRVCILTH